MADSTKAGSQAGDRGDAASPATGQGPAEDQPVAGGGISAPQQDIVGPASPVGLNPADNAAESDGGRAGDNAEQNHGQTTDDVLLDDHYYGSDVASSKDTTAEPGRVNLGAAGKTRTNDASDDPDAQAARAAADKQDFVTGGPLDDKTGR